MLGNVSEFVFNPWNVFTVHVNHWIDVYMLEICVWVYAQRIVFELTFVCVFVCSCVWRWRYVRICWCNAITFYHEWTFSMWTLKLYFTIVVNALEYINGMNALWNLLDQVVLWCALVVGYKWMNFLVKQRKKNWTIKENGINFLFCSDG